MIVLFPPSKSRRITSRRPRRSKNGTPEERAAKKAAAAGNAEIVSLPGAAAKRPLTWPDIPPACLEDGSPLVHEPPYTDAELAGLRFDGVPEFRTDGVGVGTPEFREQL